MIMQCSIATWNDNISYTSWNLKPKKGLSHTFVWHSPVSRVCVNKQNVWEEIIQKKTTQIVQRSKKLNFLYWITKKRTISNGLNNYYFQKRCFFQQFFKKYSFFTEQMFFSNKILKETILFYRKNKKRNEIEKKRTIIWKSNKSVFERLIRNKQNESFSGTMNNWNAKKDERAYLHDPWLEIVLSQDKIFQLTIWKIVLTIIGIFIQIYQSTKFQLLFFFFKGLLNMTLP